MQFERTLIVAEEDSFISYLEGCTAPSYDKNQVGAKNRHPPSSAMFMRERGVTAGSVEHNRDIQWTSP